MKQSEDSTATATGQLRPPRASAQVLAAVVAYERTLFLTRRAAAARAASVTTGDEPATGAIDATRIA